MTPHQPAAVYLIPHTHWDREWYLTQRQFQYRLVWTTLEIVEALRSGRLERFTFDGQTVILEDLLEWEPGLEPVLRALIAEGKLEIGPWYTMPDLWLPTPEALRRNLARGLSDCRRWGAPVPDFAYIPDSFGMPAHLPRLLAEFGFKAMLFGRGLPPALGTAACGFRWRSPGAELTALAIPSSYGNAMGLPPATDKHRLSEWFGKLTEIHRHLPTPRLLGAFHGMDHLWVQQDLPEIIEALSELFPQTRFRQALLSEYVRDVLAATDTASLPEYSGALQGTLTDQELHGTWSARQDIKSADHRADAWLRRAEHVADLAAEAGVRVLRRPLAKAWDWLLQNHAHDSICGCSPDPTALDQHTRYRHVEQVATDTIEEALHGYAWKQAGPTRSLVLAPPPRGSVLGLAEVSWDADESEPPTFTLQGEPLRHQHLGTQRLTRHDVGGPHFLTIKVEESPFHRHRLLLQLPANLAGIALAEPRPSTPSAPQGSPSDARPRLSAAAVLGMVAKLETVPDIGGLYAHHPQGEPRLHEPAQTSAQSEAGPLRWRTEATLSYDPWSDPTTKGPPAFALRRELAIDTFAHLPLAIVRERWMGSIRNMRIRLPLSMQGGVATILRDELDDVRDATIAQLRETPASDASQRSFFFRSWVQARAAGDDAAALTFFGNGLHEFGLADDAAGIAVTLLRPQGFVYICADWPAPGAQLDGAAEFTYALWLGDIDPARCAQLSDELAAPVIAESAPNHEPPGLGAHGHATIKVRTGDGTEAPDRALGWRPVQNHRSGWRRDRAPFSVAGHLGAPPA